jgi:hypothetical protein
MSDAQTESEELVNALMPRVEGMLNAHGEFGPFGGAITLDGDLAQFSVDEQHRDSSMEVIVEVLKSKLRDGVGTYRATALVFPVHAQLPGADTETEAVAIALDHKADYSVVLMIPYAFSGGAVEFGEAVAQQGEHEIFQRQH